MIHLKTLQEINLIRKAGSIVSEVVAKLGENLTDGVTSEDLDRIAAEMIRSKGAEPTFIGYQGYPKTICVSINCEVVHGIPSTKTVIRSGDVVGIDCAVTYGGYVADHAKTFIVKGAPKNLINEKLVMQTEKALHIGISNAIPGGRIGDIGSSIQRVAEQNNLAVVKDFVGHGVGKKMHEEPQVPNFGLSGTGVRLKQGMVIAIEPMFNLGSDKVKVLNDGWTVVTVDRQNSAHFEHTIVITENGPEILTIF